MKPISVSMNVAGLLLEIAAAIEDRAPYRGGRQLTEGE